MKNITPDYFTKLLDGGVDAHQISSADFEIIKQFEDLIKEEADETLRSSLHTALLKKKRDIAWRGNHIEDLNLSIYLNYLSSFFLITALVCALALNVFTDNVFIKLALLLFMVLSVLIVVGALKSRQKLWEGYAAFIDRRGALCDKKK